jgi:putative ATP-dependent endonuclease of OLD family
MRVEEIHVKNFRCIKEASLPCEKLTVLVGANGVGKSAFLHALDLFYTLGANYDENDFYGGDVEEPISITVIFCDLSDAERELFSSYVEGETLGVEKVLTYPRGKGSERYFGKRFQNPHFVEIRRAPNATEQRRLYDEIRADYELPTVRRAGDIEEHLRAWEQQHREECERIRDDGQFFGFKEVGRARLERFTAFILIPAVRDAASDAVEGKGSVLTQLLELVVHKVLAQKEELKALREEVQQRYAELMSADNLTELQQLEESLSQTLQNYVPDASVDLKWMIPDQIDIPLPRAEARLIEDQFSSPVDRTGHGLQRAFVFTMLQYLAMHQVSSSGGTEEGPEQGTEAPADAEQPTPGVTLILGIEEPELYQHPSRQRHLASILFGLSQSGIPGVIPAVQVIYTTHSPLFVDIGRFDAIRVLRKMTAEDEPGSTCLAYTCLDDVCRVIERACGQPEGTFTGETLRPRLRTLMTPWMNEGFFADVVVLVEGEDDRAAVLGFARHLGHDFDRMGISVIPCNGKSNLDRPIAIFESLRIPVYVVWDGDADETDQREREKSAEANRRLLTLLGAPPEDWPSGAVADFACFRECLEKTLQSDLGEELYDTVLADTQTELGFQRRKDAMKSPEFVHRLIERAAGQGNMAPTLEAVVGCIVDKARH